MLLLSPIWIAMMTRRRGEPVAWFQAGAAPVALIAWVLAIGGPFDLLVPAGFEVPLGSMALIVVTLLVPVAERLFVR